MKRLKEKNQVLTSSPLYRDNFEINRSNFELLHRRLTSGASTKNQLSINLAILGVVLIPIFTAISSVIKNNVILLGISISSFIILILFCFWLARRYADLSFGESVKAEAVEEILGIMKTRNKDEYKLADIIQKKVDERKKSLVIRLLRLKVKI